MTNHINVVELQEILNNWDIDCDVNLILSAWNKPYRFYHNMSHLVDLLNLINADKSKLSKKDYEKLVITAVFHDYIYNPTRTDNEEQSVKSFMECVLTINKKDKDILEIKQMILNTKNHYSNTFLSKIFNNYDMDIVKRDFVKLLNWEKGIYQEYNYLSDAVYKKNRLSFLKSIICENSNNSDNLLKLIDWVDENY